MSFLGHCGARPRWLGLGRRLGSDMPGGASGSPSRPGHGAYRRAVRHHGGVGCHGRAPRGSDVTGRSHARGRLDPRRLGPHPGGPPAGLPARSGTGIADSSSSTVRLLKHGTLRAGVTDLLKTALLAMVCVFTLLAQSSTSTAKSPLKPGFDINAMDKTADPCTNFYQFACGNWIKNNPIPADQ